MCIFKHENIFALSSYFIHENFLNITISLFDFMHKNFHITYLK